MTNISFAILVDRIEHLADDTALLLEFWYFGAQPIPETKEEQLQYFHHLMTGKCIQTELKPMANCKKAY
jgi:hypothetical protein